MSIMNLVSIFLLQFSLPCFIEESYSAWLPACKQVLYLLKIYLEALELILKYLAITHK